MNHRKLRQRPVGRQSRAALARAFDLLGLLASRPGLSATQLATATGTTERTVFRTVQALRSIGFHIRSDRRRGGYYVAGADALAAGLAAARSLPADRLVPALQRERPLCDCNTAAEVLDLIDQLAGGAAATLDDLANEYGRTPGAMARTLYALTLAGLRLDRDRRTGAYGMAGGPELATALRRVRA